MPSKLDRIRLDRNHDRRTRVTEEQIEEIRDLHNKGLTQKDIANLYNISQSTVCYIVSEHAHDNLARYRKINPPKRRTREESREYMRDLRKYKRKIMKETGGKI